MPAGRVTLRPLRPSPVGELTVRGLSLGGAAARRAAHAGRRPEILTAPPGLTLHLS